jgi:predicted heme/steroid binding protein
MSKISTYEVAPVPKLSDKLIGTSVGGEIEDITYNFTLLELLELFLPVIPANNLQGVLDYGNTATQDINLFGTITTTNLDVTDTANLFITYLNEETHIVGSLFDSVDSIGTAGQVLTSTGDGVEWFTLPPIFTPNLQQVLTEGNTADIDIILDANIEALDVTADTIEALSNITIGGTLTDGAASIGAAGKVLGSTGAGVQWVDFPSYSATSPLFLNAGTGVFSIQVANSTQGGYLTANDWITFDGKQNAGNYITALTGEATANGPGSVPITLNNASVIAKVLTGLNITGGSISASDSILTAFGKVQNQINGLIGGVQYKGTWDAATNTPVLVSSVGVQGNYYIVSVAGNTDLNGITDWKVGDWAIFNDSSWQKVDNTESVTSVNGQVGAVSLTTDNIPEGTTNLYYLNSRARAALSFVAGSGAYNNTTGVITIPTDNSQILNGAGYITLSSLSASAPLNYNNLTGVFSIPQAAILQDGYLSATDWATFNNKQNYLGGTGLVKSSAGTITYITDNSGNWNTAYNDSIVSAAVTGTATKTLTLNQQDGGTIQASWTDLDTGLTSVGVTMPSAFSVANSPLTANGTIGITGAGTSLQYIDGTGALQTFPGLTGFVPYIGANNNVDLGEYGISAGYFQADLTPTGALQVGRMQWNPIEGTMDLRLMGNNVTLQVGQENVTRVVNKTGIDLMEANYQVVRVRKTAEGGAQGQRLAVLLAQGNNENNSTEVLGLVTETILVNQEGFVTSFGEVKNINTTGSLQSETWVDGDILYVSPTIPGQLTNIRPTAPNHAVTVGYVTYAHANNGKIYMAIDTGYELGELHNVYAPNPTANQSIYWNIANSRYELNTIGGILGYTPANAATTLTINGITYDLSANRTWSVGTVTSVAALTLGTAGSDLSSTVANGTTTPVITLNVPTASAANRGALSAADWSTFNTKVGGVTASSPLFSSGGQTPNITIQQSSGSQDGYLSAADWSTFNNKQAAGNYITSLTGEATASGPGAAAVTLNNASVTGKILTGVNITGGTVLATDTMLTAFGKLQNQINGLVGGSIYQGTWNASTNTPALASGVGTKGYYYIVSVAGSTNLDGITDWFVGDWAIFDGTAWQQVDNTDAVVSVNGQTGAVSLTTDNISEGVTNQYFTTARARASLSFVAGSGAYNSSTGVITIPTNTNQLTNGASFITLASLSGVAPITYNNGTGAISITQAGTASNGYLSSTDWNTFNNKAPSVVGGYLPLSGGALTGPLTSSSSAIFLYQSGGFALKVDSVSSGTENDLRFAKGGVDYGAIQTNGSNGDFEFYVETTGTGGWMQSVILKRDATKIDFLISNAINTTINSSGLSSVGGTFSSNVYVSGGAITNTGNGVHLFYESTYAQIQLNGTLTGGSLIDFSTSGTDYKGRIIYRNATNQFEFNTNSVGTPALILASTGAATFSSSVTASQFLASSSSNAAIITSTGISGFGLVASGSAGGARDIFLAGQSGFSNGFTVQYDGSNMVYKMLNGNLTISSLAGTGTRMVVADASGVLSTQAISGGTITGSGTTNKVAKFTSSSAIGDSIITATADDVTITSTLTGPMFVLDNTNVNGYSQMQFKGGFNAYIFKGNNGYTSYGGANALNFYTDSGGGGFAFYPQGAISVFMDSAGNLGVGVGTTLSAKFEVGGGNAIITNTINGHGGLSVRNPSTGSSAYSGVLIGNDSSTVAGGILMLGTGYATTGGYTSNGLYVFGNRTGGVTIAAEAGTIKFVTSTSIKGTMLANGNLGLNETAPTNLLHLAGNVATPSLRLASTSTGFWYDIGRENATTGDFLINGTYSGTSNGTLFRIHQTNFTVTTAGSINVKNTSTTASVNPAVMALGEYMATGSSAGYFWENRSGSVTLTSNWYGWYATSSIVRLWNGNSDIFTINGSTGAATFIGNVSINGTVIGTDQTFGGAYRTFAFGTNSNGFNRIFAANDASDGMYLNAATGQGINFRVNGGGSNVFTVASNGVATFSSSLGIGRTPTTIFDVTGSTGAALVYIQNNGITGYSGIDIYRQNGTHAGSVWCANDSAGASNNRNALTLAARVSGEKVIIVGGGYDPTVTGGLTIQGATTILQGSDAYHKINSTSGSYGYLWFSIYNTSTAVSQDSYLVQNKSGSTTNGVTAGSLYFYMASSQNFEYSWAGVTKISFTAAGNITASAFFESSDKRLKTLIKDDYRAIGVDSVKAKLYLKNGKEEIGYYAQDVQGILPSAVSKNDAGFLSLSYTQVHTAKIAIIEDEVDVLKRRVTELEFKLQKYEA